MQISNVNLQKVTCDDSLLVPLLFTGDARQPIGELNLSDIVIAQSGSTEVAQIANAANVNAAAIIFEGKPVLFPKTRPLALPFRLRQT